MPGFKALTSRKTVLIGSNVAGYKLWYIWHSENPRTFKHINKHTHPVYYRSKKVVDDPAPHLRCPAELLCWQNGEICVWRITHLSRFCLLIMLPDILLLLVIFIPMSSSVSLSKHHLFGPTNRSRFIATLKSTAWGGPLPGLLLQLRKTLMQHLQLYQELSLNLGWCHHGLFDWHVKEDSQEVYPTAWMKLESIMLSEISQEVRDKYHMISPLTGT